MKKIFVFIPVFLIAVLVFSAVTPVINMSEDISTKVFRLHILANSNEEYDQSLKLKVRDEILKLSEDIFSECENVEEAIEASQNNIESIRNTALKVINDNGYNYSVKVYTTKEYFNTRDYDDFTLPAGIYNSLKIEIGEAKGKNWWCVMFPQVCVSGCTDDFNGVLTDEEKEMINSGGYIVRFKIVEIYERLKHAANNS